MTQSLTGQEHATVLAEAGDAAPGGDLRATIIGCTAILLWAALALLTRSRPRASRLSSCWP